MPPTKAALEEHFKIAAYQGGHVWGQVLLPASELPSPTEWGWTKNDKGKYEPHWTSLPEAALICDELVSCKCKKDCVKCCKCKKAALELGQRSQDAYHFSDLVTISGGEREIHKFRARIGYTNVAETPDGQEVFIRIYTLLIGPHDQMNAPNAEWDLSRWFSFWISPHGEIQHVYHPPGEEAEILAIKKGMAALFASRLHHDKSWMKETEDGWQYHVQEVGHEGLHNSTYTVKSHAQGKVFTKVRHGHPVKHAEGDYTKTLHFDNELGNIHTVHINESFRTMHKTDSDFNPYHNTRPMHPENHFSNIDIPEMSAWANGNLVFMTRFKTDEIPKRPEAELQRSSIELGQVNLKRHCKPNTKDVLNYISGNLTCMRNEPREGSSQMSTCFHNIVANLRDLSDKSVTKLADHFIRYSIRVRSSIVDRNHMTDAIAFLDNDLSQKILLDRVLGHPHPDPFLYQRYLVHIVAKDTPPLTEVISKLEDLVFNPDGFPHELHDGVSYHSTILTLGAVGGQLRASGMEDQALRIVNKLHTWLGFHDPWQFRKKRSTMNEDEVRDADQWKVILLEAVGNAGLDQSFVYIESHVNSTNSNWVKRAGIHAMRQYHHQRALNVILKTALYDVDEKVRFAAMLQYKAHPLASMIAPLQTHSGSENGSVFYADSEDVGVYDLAVHNRHRRSFLDVLNFELRSPSVNWAKVLGSKDLGASLEVLVNNFLKLDIQPLSGEVILNIHDEARAIIHLGFVNTNIDFFIARLCFKGHAAYNLNILQEFGVDNLQKLAKMYDDIKGNAVDAVKTAIETFDSLLNEDNPIGDIFAAFIDALEDMPKKILTVATKTLEATRVMGEMDKELLPPFMIPTFNLVNKVSNLINDVRMDLLRFYNTVKDAIIILPNSAIQIVESIDKIIHGFDNFNDNPMGAIGSLAGNVIQVGVSVKDMVDAINKTKNACFFLKGDRPYWWDLKGEISIIKTMSIKAVNSINNGAPKWLESAKKSAKDGTDVIAKVTRGMYTTADMYQSVMNTGKRVMTDILEPFDDLKDLGGPFLKSYEKISKLITTMKKAYNDLKEGYRTARSLVDQVFGPKCHKEFPRKVRLAGNGCKGVGGFVAKLDKPGTPEYDSEGMDLVISAGNKVVAPFGGKLYRSPNKNELIIEPTGGSLKKTKIIISNVIPNKTVSDSKQIPDIVGAGEQIGVAAMTPCLNHIHFALKRGTGFVDPKNYLRVRLPEMPKWVQECDDYKLVFKGKTIREGSLIGKKGKKENDTSPERTGNTVANPPSIPEDKKPAAKLNAASDSPDSMYQKQKEKKEEIAAKSETTKDKALATLFKNPLGFIKRFKPSDIKIGSLVGMLHTMNLVESSEKLANVIKILKEMIDNKPCFNPHQMTDEQLRNELTERGMNPEGSRKAMIARLSKPPNRCPGISLSLPKNVFCTIDSECLGIECCAFFKLGIFRKTFKLYARLDACNLQFIVGVEKKFEKVFGANDGLKDMYTGNMLIIIIFFLIFTFNIFHFFLIVFLVQYILHFKLNFVCSLERVSTNTRVLKHGQSLVKLESVHRKWEYSSFEKLMKTKVKINMFDSEFELIIKLRFEKDDKGAYITLGTGFCQPDDSNNCMGFFNLLDMMPLMLPICLEDGSMKWPQIDYKKMFSRDAIKQRLKENAEKAAKELARTAINEILKELPCISPDAPGKASTCPRPDAMTVDLLKSELEKRNLPQDGTHDVLKQRLYNATQECTVFNKKLKLPQIKNEKIRKMISLSIGEKCLRIDACLDMKIEKLDFYKAIKAYIEVDACKFTLTISFMNCPRKIILLGYDWGKPNEETISKTIAIKYTIGRNEEKKVFVIDFGLKFGFEALSFDSYLLEGLEVPIPLCNDKFQLPGTGLIKDLAKEMGSRLTNEVVDVIFKQLGLDTIFLDGQCALPSPTTDCPWDVTKVTQYIPEKFKDKVTCVLPENCFGLHCCIDFAFTIPVFKNVIEKNIPFFLKFNPCEIEVEVGFGGFNHKEKLISYNYGTPITLTAGKGETKPITIVLTIGKYELGFEISLHLTVCIPIDDEVYCVPEGGLQILNKEQIPACDANALFNMTQQTGSLADWAKSKGIDLVNGMARGAVDLLLIESGASQYLKTDRCDPTREPYSPSVGGWKNDCKLSTRKLPTLPKGLYCHIASSCSKIDCCFVVPFLADMTFNAVLNIDMCDYFVFAALEKVEFKQYIIGSQIDWNTGIQSPVKDLLESGSSLYGDTRGIQSPVKDLLESGCSLYGDTRGIQSPVKDLLESGSSLYGDTRGIQSPVKDLLESGCSLYGDTRGIQSPVKDLLESGCSLYGDTRGIQSPVKDLLESGSSLYGNTRGIQSPVKDLLESGCSLYGNTRGIQSPVKDLLESGSSLYGDTRGIQSPVKDLLESGCSLYGDTRGIVSRIQSPVKDLLESGSSLYDDTRGIQSPVKDLLESGSSLYGDTRGIQSPVKDLLESGSSLYGDTRGIQSPVKDLLESGSSLYGDTRGIVSKEYSPVKDLLESGSSLYGDTRGIQSPVKDLLESGSSLYGDTRGIQSPVKDLLESGSPLYGDTRGIVSSLKKSVEIANMFFADINIFLFTIQFHIKKSDKKFIIDLDLRVCFGNEGCQFERPILVGTEIPQLLCDLSVKLGGWENFSLKKWALERGQDLASGLVGEAVNLFLQQTGLADKLLKPGCDRSSLKYIPANAKNWKNECKYSSLVKLPDISKLPVNCHISDKCLGIDCCMSLDFLSGLSINTFFNIDLCNYVIEGHIETFSFKINVLTYEWGMWFKIDRLLAHEMFVIDLSVHICFGGDTCEINVVLFDKSQVPMPGCNMEQGFKIPDFNFDQWLGGNTMTAFLAKKMMEELDIMKFMQDKKCEHYRPPYKEVTNGWNSACPKTIALPPLPNNLHCHVTDYCTGIRCCLAVPQISWNFEVYLLLNTCDFYFSVGIERLDYTFTLNGYDWGTKKKFDIGGIFKVEYSVDDLKDSKLFVVNMDLSVCLVAGQPCSLTITVFKDLMLPKPFCDWEAMDSMKDFSLKTFLQEQQLSLTAPLGKLAADMLLEKLDVAQFLKDPPCSTNGRGADGWTSACPQNLSLPVLPTNMACSVPDHCTALDCCLDVPFIQKSLNFKVDLNMCEFSLTVSVENVEVKIMLFKYVWVYYGLHVCFIHSYVIDELEADKKFVISVNVSVCLDASSTCLITVPILTNVLFPKLFCDWDNTLSLQGVSLSSLLSEMKVTPGQLLSDLAKAMIAEKFGIAAYLKKPSCQIGVGIHKATDGQWNKACPLDQSLPTLPSSVVCHIPSYCTGIDCCAEADNIGMSFNARVLLNACDFSLEVGIEALDYKISLVEYNWNQWETFNLKGVVKIEFKIDDLQKSRKFLVSLNVQLCFESTCLPKMTILTDASFPKPFCNWDDDINLTPFSLVEFMKDNVVAAGETLTSLVLSEMIDKIGIGHYLKNPMCDRSSPPYQGAVNRWKKDCPAAIELPTLPPEATCHLSDPCGTIDCCVDVALLQRSFNLKIGINFCEYSFTMAIENFGFHKTINFYKFGKLFMIADLFGENKFVMSLSISLCWEKDICVLNFPVLVNAHMPKPLCDWTSDFKLGPFLTSLNANTMATLTSSIADQLFEKNDIGKYLKNPQCSQTSSVYTPNTQGWKNDCPLPGIDSYLPALSDTTCHISSICTEMECCIKTAFLPHAFNAMISVDMCNYILTLRFENLEHREILLDFSSRQTGHFYVKGILRFDYELVDKKADRKMEMTVSLSVCLEETSCLYQKTILNKVDIPKPFCDWKGMLAARSLPVSDWMKDQGLEVGAALNNLDKTMQSRLLHELGALPYLLPTPCQLSESKYSTANSKNWKDDCGSTSVQLLQLPSEARCHITDSCSAIDCCVQIPYVKRTVHLTFNLDICKLTLDLSLENLKYTVSLMEYNWNTEDEFILGSLGRLSYKLEHKPSEQKVVLDASLKFCIGDSCFITVPIFSQAEISYSPCKPSIPVPFKGVSLDFWNPTKCRKSTADNGCSVTLPASVSEVGSVADNCMGIRFCLPLDLKHLGSYSLSAGIDIDYCGNQKLNLFVENKSWQKELSTITFDVDHTEKMGEAIILTYRVVKTATLFKLSLGVKVCVKNGIDQSDYCIENQILNQLIFTIPKCGIAKRRRKRSSIIDGLLEKTRDPRELTSLLIAAGATNAQITEAFDKLKKFEAEEVARRQTPTDGDMSNVKSAAKTMGNRNPGTLLYSSPAGGGLVTLEVEGADKIQEMLGSGVEIAGRVHQTFIVGKGLTKAGMKLLSAKMADMTLGEISALLDMKNIDPELALKLAKNIKELIQSLTTELIKGFSEGGDNMFKAFDLTLTGDFSFPRQDIELFKYKQAFPLGGFITLLFEFGAGCSYGMDITAGAKILSMQVTSVLRPFSNVKVFGSVGLGILNIYGKLILRGYIMEVAFPSTAEIVFSKFPLDITLKIDMELIPLQLKLSAKVTMDLWLTEVTLYETDLWKFSTAMIRKNILNLGKKEEDKSPPQVLSYVDNTQNGGRRRRSSPDAGGCIADQLPDRDYTEAVVEVAVRAEDDVSQVELTVNVGTEPGLDDVVSGVKLGGPSSIMKHVGIHICVEFSLEIRKGMDFKPHGQKLYFTVIASNSGGGSTTVMCSIPTFDITPPGGRVLQEFLTTSNPTILKASVLVFEDSEIEYSAVGIGYGKGIYADETSSFTEINLKRQNMDPYDATSDPRAEKALDYFIAGRSGRLNGPIIAEFKDVLHAGECVQKCLVLHGSKCLSVNYDFGEAGLCELVESIDGHEHKVAQFGRFMHYERKGVGMAYELVKRGLSLGHNRLHYFNIYLRNVLHYSNIISSHMILVDFTPPTPVIDSYTSIIKNIPFLCFIQAFLLFSTLGPLQNVSVDKLEVVPCLTLIPSDRPEWKVNCKDVSSSVNNHRVIHDGPGSMTVFNGDTPLQDLLYTRSNKYVAANWDGIQDRESGILGYTWTVGRSPCEELIHPHHDPHKHFFDKSEWTNIGLISPIPAEHNPLPDGLYYITVRALNNVKYGGPLTTTICHTTPYAIDNTKPFVHEVFNVKYDEETFIVSAQYNATDPESHIREVDICIGETTHDCYIMQWQRLKHSETGVSYKFEIPGGKPAWVKIRAINHVDLMKVRSADSPIVIDITPPTPGIVYDGSIYKHDLDFTKNNTEICANWADFFDTESGIAFYTLQLLDSENNILNELAELPRHSHEACMKLDEEKYLEHNRTYHMAVWASNAGHKQLNSSAASDGVLVDLTPPVAGEIIDGKLGGFEDISFSLHRATVAAQWRNFSDMESDIRDFELEITRAVDMNEDYQVIHNWKSLGRYADKVEWHHFHLNHRDVVKSKLRVTNGALNNIELESSGFVVDLTAPVLVYLGDGAEAKFDIEYQSSLTTLEANFLFVDEESGLDHFKYQVFELYGGNKHQVYPVALNEWIRIDDVSSTSLTTPTLSLKPGALYTVRVAAINKAGSMGIYITNGVVVDDTPPDLRWVHVGIFEGDEEEVVDGKVIQQDPNGIKATWFATDAQSGVTSYKIAVGNTPGSNNVLDWKDVLKRDQYIDGLSLINNQIYYVMVKAINGADMESPQMVSKPLLKVEEDRAGLVIDGPEGTERANDFTVGVDIDYQKDFSTVTVQFEGFTSHEHGIRYFDWAVGTTVGGEEVQPFMVAGLVHEESQSNVPGNGIATSGSGQAVLPLEEGTKYYTTVRGITNSGKILHSKSDGFTVDTTPPKIKIESVAAQGKKTLVPGDSTIFQVEDQSINAQWMASDEQSPVVYMSYAFGTYPYGTNSLQLESIGFRNGEQASLSSDFKPLTQGKPNILTVVAENEVGLVSRKFFPTVVIDNTPPKVGVLSCKKFIQPHSPIVCTWDGFFEAESQIKEIQFQIGSQEGMDDVLAPVSLPGHTTMYQAKGLEDKLVSSRQYYATVTVINILDMTVSASFGPMTVDTTPPVAGTIVELSSIYYIDTTNSIDPEVLNPIKCNTAEDCEKLDSVCHQSYTSISIAFQGFNDPETGIVRYQVAVGNTPGGGQIRPLFDIPLDKHYLTIQDLVLKGERQVFVTVHATNGAGLGTMATSNGVYMSYLSQGDEPLSHIAVSDTDGGHIDVDFQTSTSSLSAMWDVSGDPCPVDKYEWAIERADGYVVQQFTDAEGRLVGVNDDLQMIGKEQYYIKLRVTNKEGYTYTIRSNGIQIEEDPLKPGNVYIGDVVGFSLKFLPTKRKVTANWDRFGNDGIDAGEEEAVIAEDESDKNKASSNQQIAYYELALGTDRRFPKTRDNIVPFTNVGLNKTHTFYDIDNLVVYKAVYYFTVRAHSTSGAVAQITSNGFSVGYDGGVVAGNIKMERYINTKDLLNIQWDGFESEVEIMMYYVGVSTTTEASNHTCKEFTESGRLSAEDLKRIFDVVEIHNVGKDTFYTIKSLNLQQNAVYYSWVIGADQSGKCAMVKFLFQVDVTAPVEGRLKAGPYYDLALTYAHEKKKLDVSWENYKDEESGIKLYYLSLLRRQSCDDGAMEEVVVEPVKLSPSLSSFQFLLDFDLQPGHPYYVKLTVKNHASLSTTTLSPPILYDNSKPTAGRVAKGHNFRDDIVWYGSVSTITGCFLHLPTPVGEACPANSMPFDADGWSFLNTDKVYETSDHKLKLSYSEKYVYVDRDELGIKLTRSPGKDLMLSGAYYRHADMLQGGQYKLKIKAAKPTLDAGQKLKTADQVVTSVIFWDGPTKLDYFLDLDYTPKHNLEDNSCACCDNEPVDIETCLCDCVTRTRVKRSSDTEYEVKKLSKENLKKLKSTGKLTPDITVEKKQDRHRSCGLQVYGGEMKKIVAWCASSEKLQAPLVEQYDLDFDPADDFHDYTLNFLISKDESRASEETWCFSVFIDGDLATKNCGVPYLSKSTRLIFAAWNYKNSMPHNVNDLKGFPKVWSAKATFRDLVLPPDSSHLCRVGAPFRGGNNAIIAYEAGIGSSPLTDNISQFTKVKSTCVPCDRPCDHFVCETDCKNDTTELIKFQLDGLALATTKVIDGKIEPIAYFLTVKAVLASGVSAVASSEKFNIDITDPVFNASYLLYIDVGQGKYRPTRFQKSNNTIKVIWKCEDDESNVMEYQWAIGTSVGAQDIQNYTSTGEKATGTNSDLEGVLKDKQTYYISIKCTNGAGMTTTYEDPENITVMYVPPKASTVPTQLEGVTAIPGNVIPENAMESSDQNSVSASWEVSPDPEVERYDICVGSSPTFSQDVLPCVLVALDIAGTAEIKDGWLWVSGTQFRKLNNYRPGNTENQPTSRASFRMPPGSVLYIYMQICNAANACDTKLVGTKQVTSESTEIQTCVGGRPIEVVLNTGTGVGRRRRAVNAGIKIVTPTGLPDGQSIAVTLLTKSDLEADYRSDASADYVPYITNPAASLTSSTFLDRILNGRLTYNASDTSFSVTSIGGLPMIGPLEISFPYDPADTTFIGSLLYFNPGVQKWLQAKDTCQFEASPITYDAANSLVTVKVCSTRNINTSVQRRRRSAHEVFFSEPTQFLLTAMQQAIPNTPPQLTSTTAVTMLEDAGTLIYQMTYFDADDDTIEFSLDVGPDINVFGNLTITPGGLFIFTPCTNCYGTANVTVTLNEVPVPDIPPKSTTVTITIDVSPLQDPPVIFVFDKNSYILFPDKTVPVEILVEENIPNSTVNVQYDIFVGGYDFDNSDNLTALVSQPANGTIVVGDVKKTIPDCAVAASTCYDLVLPMSSDRLSWAHTMLTYNPSEGFHGFEEVRVYVQDANGSISDITTLSIAVMESPCQHDSQCQSKNESAYTCTHANRATAFDDFYTCVCQPGWEGIHCGIDVDECSSNPCNWPYVCFDEVNGYHCACALDNPNCDGLEPWMIALIVVFLLLAITLSFITWYIYMVRRGRLKWSWLWDRIFHKSAHSGKTPKRAFINEGFLQNELHSAESALEKKPAVFLASPGLTMPPSTSISTLKTTAPSCAGRRMSGILSVTPTSLAAVETELQD
ncbi:uncharacterized protein LOC121390363 [Gigantopelta aegis]|uniref:uncharacterized protein LOC121390363 n=1 Tax=Gigantopelta aegis TaxID=1735272 RepID=UPI001B88E5D8|nr:uncharacterized protein LOC121390363 [Gigantopelta aegis]